MAMCPDCQTDHDGYPDGSAGALLRCLRVQAGALGAVGLVDQVDALRRDIGTRRDEAVARYLRS